jgi:indolepyruvate ferredoxin oxidoreductase beta subunit
VRQETRVEPGQLLRVREFLHPRTDEMADILPAGLGRRLFASKWARQAMERAMHRGMLVETTSISGFLKLWILARLRRWRRRTLRFEREQARIREWLALLPALAADDYALALEAARYPEMRRGYGETHARGCLEFDRALAALPRKAVQV